VLVHQNNMAGCRDLYIAREVALIKSHEVKGHSACNSAVAKHDCVFKAFLRSLGKHSLFQALEASIVELLNLLYVLNIYQFCSLSIGNGMVQSSRTINCIIFVP
jgi:hypothetical protein